MKHSLLILLSLLMIKPLSAQTPIDTVAVESDVKIKELVLPVALIGVGSLGFVEPVQSFRYEVRDRLDEWRGERRFHSRDIYGKRITLEVYKYIRGVVKFANLDEVRKQIDKDVLQISEFMDDLVAKMKD